MYNKLTKLAFCIQQNQMHSLSFAGGTYMTRWNVKWELHRQ